MNRTSQFAFSRSSTLKSTLSPSPNPSPEAERVFGGSVTPCLSQLTQFGGQVAQCPPSRERLFVLLDMVEAIRDLRPAVGETGGFMGETGEKVGGKLGESWGIVGGKCRKRGGKGGEKGVKMRV